jgi:hypothetical protein
MEAPTPFLLTQSTDKAAAPNPLNRLRICKTVQLKVDRNTEAYKIFLTGYADFDANVKAATEVYDSGANECCTLSSGLILGRAVDDDWVA